MSDRGTNALRMTGRIALALGAFLLVLSALSNASVIRYLEPDNKLMQETLDEARRSRIEFAIAGFVLIAAGVLGPRMRSAAALFERRWLVRVALFAFFLWFPVFVLEGALRPFVERQTTIFMRDADLGWKLKPLAEDYYAGTWARINSLGLRGPERGHAKPAGTSRVLFLGDSVTFGFGIIDDALTLPATVERDLVRDLARPVECINGGVDGYAPWQQHGFLVREGLSYEPDLVVVCFVLNDVDERYRLKRFGGTGDGIQLARTLSENDVPWIETSSIMHFVWRATGRLRFGHDVEEGARVKQLFDTYDVMSYPNRDDVQAAWKATLDDLDAILDACRERSIPMLLVAFPYATQLYRPDLNSPQWILGRFAERRELPFVDLQQVYLVAVEQRPVPIDDLFLDPIHPKALGTEIAAHEIARVIVARSLLAK